MPMSNHVISDEEIELIKKYLREYDGDEICLMEVCGSHTQAISKYGISELLSEKIKLLSGPGCPVCVTPSAYIDRLIEIARMDGHFVYCFGDMMKVPGSKESLSLAKSSGAKVDYIYSPWDLVSLAKDNPKNTYVFAAVGFETTAPVYALLVDKILEDNIQNIKLLTTLKVMPPAIDFLCENGNKIDGFIAPGHVAAITGSKLFEPIASKRNVPFSVAGFDAKELLTAIYGLVKEVISVRAGNKAKVLNYYPAVVSKEGNIKATALIDKYFATGAAIWRGIGEIENSGLYLRDEFKNLDMGSGDCKEDILKNKACSCAKVLTGKIIPTQCPLFGNVCTPMNPQGACMVSSEGSCAQFLAYHRKR